MANPTASIPTTKDNSGELSISLLIQFLSLITPYFIVFFFVILSILNSNIKGFIFFFVFLIIYAIISIFKNSLPPNDLTGDKICSILGKYHGNQPSFISALYTYTFIYMILPMSFNNTFNIPLIMLLLIIIFVDYLTRVYIYKCIDYKHVSIGMIIGLVIGFFWTYTLKQSGQKGLLFHDELLTNRETCSKTKGNFKCKVFKGSEYFATDGVVIASATDPTETK